MKKVILLSISIIISSYTFSQKYTPLNIENGIWVSHTEIPMNGIDDTYVYYCKGDTIINTEKYRKLNAFYHGFTTLVPFKDVGYQGAIRNDILNKQVLYINKGNLRIDTILNFNYKTGDTIFDTNHNEITRIVSSDSVKICGKYLKRFITSRYIPMCYETYSHNDSISLIEGIGFSSFFPYAEFYDCFEARFNLVCYTEYMNDSCDCKIADLPLEIIENLHYNKNTEIIYNQKLEELQIRATENIKSINLISMTGKTISVWSDCGENCKLPLNSLIRGIYIVNCVLKNGSVINKKVVVI